MKFFLNALLVTGAVAQVVRRQGTTVEQVGQDIVALNGKILAVEKAVAAFNGDAQQAVAIQSAAKELSEAVAKGTQDAKGLPELKQEDALGVASPVQDLNKNINMTIDGLIAKKDAFVKAGLGGAVHEILVQQQKGASDFVDALIGKLPTELKPIGQKLAQPVLDAVKRGVDAFAGLSGSVASAEAGVAASAPKPNPPMPNTEKGSSDKGGSDKGTPTPTTMSSDNAPMHPGTAGGYGAPPPPPMNTTVPMGGNNTNTTTPIVPYTGTSSTTAASAASAFGVSALLALVAVAVL